MNQIKFNEWQEMALKKDTETILRKLTKNEPVLLSICWEVVLSFVVLMLDHLFGQEKTDAWVWILCVAIAAVPAFVILACRIFYAIKGILKAYSGKYNVKELIDLFDNQICYWVMTGNSYGKMLLNVLENDPSESIFFYQECCYYTNKAIGALYKMMPIIDKVFTLSPEKTVTNGLIQLQRLFGMIKLIERNGAIVMDFKDNLMDSARFDESIEEQEMVNALYRKYLEDFKTEIEKCFQQKV